MNLETSLVYFVNDGILAGKSPATLKGYQHSISILLNYTRNNFLPQNVSSIGSETLSSFFLEGVKIHKWNKYTHWTHYKNLNAFFNWSIKKQIISVNPLSTIPKPKIPSQTPKSLTEGEAKDVLKIVSSLSSKYYFPRLRNKALVAMILFTGIRKSELTNLKVEDVDILNGFISIESGKGGKRREIPIEETNLKPILIDYLDYRVTLGKTSDWFFNGTFKNHGKSDNKLSIGTIDRLFRTISKILGKRVYSHKLRHTFATIFLDKTDDIYTLQQIMGHSNISTTCIYLSSSRKKKIEAIRKLNFT